MRPSLVEVDLGAIAHNVGALSELVAPAELCAVVKADGYGHGDVPVAETALSAGAGRLAVALVEEGVRLREAGIEAPILLLSESQPADIRDVLRWSLTPTAYSASFVEALAEGVGDAGSSIGVHLCLDTGMHRVGTDADTLIALARLVDGTPGVRVEGVWTHLAVAEEDPAFTASQVELFEEAVTRLGSAGIAYGVRHVANTAGAILHRGARADMVRVGLGIYGLYPSPECRGRVELRPAMRVVSHVSLVRRHPGGTRVSYGRRRALPADSWVATVPIGYADGVPRPLSERGGGALIRGRWHPLAGTVTMDQLMVDVGETPVEVGDEVVLLGRQGALDIAADDWAAATDSISYEVVSRMGPRLPREYRR